MDERYKQYSGLLIDRPRPNVLRLTMNRPEKFNATDAGLHYALATVWRDIYADPSVNAAVAPGELFKAAFALFRKA